MPSKMLRDTIITMMGDQGPVWPIDAIGGDITYFGQFKVHTFEVGGDFEVLSGSADVEALIVAGGAAGGGMPANNFGAGGGGAGGVRLLANSTKFAVSPGIYTVVVGAAGLKITNQTGGFGSDSSFGPMAAAGGGGGYGANGFSVGFTGNGGSGGGGANTHLGGEANDGSGFVIGQGFYGGAGPNVPNFAAGGGGGSLEQGHNSEPNGGDGGDGILINFNGTPTRYGAGGGGGTFAAGTGGIGGLGGGGNAGNPIFGQFNGADATGFGCGGGGGSIDVTNGGQAGDGSPGIVMIRYPVQIVFPYTPWNALDKTAGWNFPYSADYGIATRSGASEYIRSTRNNISTSTPVKLYVEAYVSGVDIADPRMFFGVKRTSDAIVSSGGLAGTYALWRGNNTKVVGNWTDNGLAVSTIAAYDTLMLAWDTTAGFVWTGRNGVWNGGGDPAAGTNPTFTGMPAAQDHALMLATPVAGTGYYGVGVLLKSDPVDFLFTVPTGFSPITS